MTDTVLPLLSALRRISQSLDSYSKLIEARAGMSLPQRLLLEALLQSATPVSAGDLARKLSLTQGTVTIILDRLVTRGLVERRRAADDRRRVLVSLTAEGLRRAQQAPPLMADTFLKSFNRLSDSERNLLLASVTQLAALMRADDAPIASQDHKEVACVASPVSADSMDSSPISQQ
ncbi:MarR family winged helix-turn-helix transcriptional regulator [Solimonas marina]|uniref:Winged helix-turn-helix transcriptional regulator n=1 Tax=Solimonas marina TaxID=2714601 RepID=A0A970B519_9GAMM|nr:MarR family winged helix-turn-helix transcriptional regulator [Solimonas marina]NKF21095.1 winged helix-turn-helix transcriptional regulator [Solimonas marina]